MYDTIVSRFINHWSFKENIIQKEKKKKKLILYEIRHVNVNAFDYEIKIVLKNFIILVKERLAPD